MHIFINIQYLIGAYSDQIIGQLTLTIARCLNTQKGLQARSLFYIIMINLTNKETYL